MDQLEVINFAYKKQNFYGLKCYLICVRINYIVFTLPLIFQAPRVLFKIKMYHTILFLQ